MKYVVFMSQWPRAIKILISKWPRTRKFGQLFKNTGGGKIFSYDGHTLVTLYVQFLCSNCSKFDRWVHAENLCQLVMFLTVFFYWMYKMRYSCFQKSSVLHGWFVYWVFGWEVRRLSKSEIRFRMASFLFFTSGLAWCVRGFRSLKRFWPYLIAFRSYISNE